MAACIGNSIVIAIAIVVFVSVSWTELRVSVSSVCVMSLESDSK